MTPAKPIGNDSLQKQVQDEQSQRAYVRPAGRHLKHQRPVQPRAPTKHWLNDTEQYSEGSAGIVIRTGAPSRCFIDSDDRRVITQRVCQLVVRCIRSTEDACKDYAGAHLSTCQQQCFTCWFWAPCGLRTSLDRQARMFRVRVLHLDEMEVYRLSSYTV